VSGTAAVLVGDGIVLTCAASGAATLHFQWRRNGTNVGVDSPTLEVTNAQTTDSGSYSCVVSNDNGTLSSNGFAVSVLAAPAIASETPPSTVPSANTVIAFAVTATGSNLSYQWQKKNGGSWSTVTNGGLTTGATTASLSLQANASTEGEYRCRVYNAVGEVFSSAMPFYQSPPTITTQPTAVGEDGTSSVVASGHGTLSYQWFYGNVALFAQDTATLDVNAILGDIEFWRGLGFKVRVSNPFGWVESVTVGSGPFKHGTSTTSGSTQRASGSALVLHADLIGPPGTAYSWTRNGTACAGDTDIFGVSLPRLTLHNLQFSDTGVYVCTGSNEHGQAVSTAFDVEVTANANVYSQPTSPVVVFADESFSINLVARLPGKQAFQQGQYGNNAGYVRSDFALLPFDNGQQPLYSLKQQVENYVPLFLRDGYFQGSPDTFPSKAFTFNGATFPALGSVAWTIRGEQLDQAEDAPANIVSDVWANDETGAPVVGDSPIFSVSFQRAARAAIPGGTGSGETVVVLGSPIELSNQATGDNLEFQWKFTPWASGGGVGVTPIPGETSNLLMRNSATPADAGYYTARAGNRSYNSQQVVTAFNRAVNVIGITASIANFSGSTEDTVTAQYCGDNVEFALVVNGVVGAYQNSPSLVVGNNFGVPLRVRVRHKSQTAKFHDSNDFVVTQVFKWKVTYCGGASTDGFVSLNQLFANGATVSYGFGGYVDNRTLPTATAVGQSASHTGVVNGPGYPTGTHQVNFTSV